MEKLFGIVSRVTFHSVETGWSVLRVQIPGRGQFSEQTTVVLHQCKVFAGATMEFEGDWTDHPQYGRQFKALRAVEKKPATTAALEKYLGSGLIFGVGPATAKKIVNHFKEETLDIFEGKIDRLQEVSGIAQGKLKQIRSSWEEHREIRNVMMFLQNHGISTLFAVKIYKTYGQDSIKTVQENPYRLAKDIYGVGFLSADKVALSLGLKEDSRERLVAGIRHTLASAKEDGHCFLKFGQLVEGLTELLGITLEEARFQTLLAEMEVDHELRRRIIEEENCYYSKSLFYDEAEIAKRVKNLLNTKLGVDQKRLRDWIDRYCESKNISLSEEQRESVQGIAEQGFSILTGGPGCGKTTTTNVLVKLLMAMQKKVVLAAPTGRAAQRMTELIGIEAKTIHRLLQIDPKNGGFKKNDKDPLEGDFFILDECSMLDVNLSASLLKAIPSKGAQVLFIGDADQLPSVGAGNVINDLIQSGRVPVFKLTQIFRQAAKSLIIQSAHKINRGEMPFLETPFRDKEVWKTDDCLFIESEEMTKEQAKFIYRLRKTYGHELNGNGEVSEELEDFIFPKKFAHVDIDQLLAAQTHVEELKNILKKISPWSSLNFSLTALDTIKKIYLESIPKYLGEKLEIQILSPMIRGTLGTANLNQVIQESLNPWQELKPEIKLSEKRIFREGDRVIQVRNNYELGVFNGDIGIIRKIDALDMECLIQFDLKAPKGTLPREVVYKKENLMELELAYAITIHKSQGSEFDVVIIPILTQHFKMLFRNLIYTGITRAKKGAIIVGSKRAFSMSIRNIDAKKRQTALRNLL